MSYRGYFAQRSANQFAHSLQAQDYDVYVGGVAAYSTLGWFADPVLSSVVYLPDHRLAALIFHELAHQLLYVSGDTAFNESFATTVQQEGLRRWLAQNDQPQSHEQALKERSRQEQFIALVMSYREQLQQIYQSSASKAVKISRKKDKLSAMKQQYQELKQTWQSYDGYDTWFAQDLNNAQLLSVSAYYDWVPALSALLQQNQSDLGAFYQQCQLLTGKSKEDRRQFLARIDGT